MTVECLYSKLLKSFIHEQYKLQLNIKTKTNYSKSRIIKFKYRL